MAKKKELIKRRLNPKKELFCQLYASDEEFFGNGVKSYMKAYKTDEYNVAKVEASKFLTKPNILDRINILMDIVINDVVVDKELAFVIKQKDNLSAKVAAIREYNLLKSRIKQAQIPQTSPIIIILNESKKHIFPVVDAEEPLRIESKAPKKEKE